MAQKKLIEHPRIKNTVRYLACGMIDLIQAVDAVSQYYKDGSLDYDSAIEAIKILAKVKNPA